MCPFLIFYLLLLVFLKRLEINNIAIPSQIKLRANDLFGKRELNSSGPSVVPRPEMKNKKPNQNMIFPNKLCVLIAKTSGIYFLIYVYMIFFSA